MSDPRNPVDVIEDLQIKLDKANLRCNVITIKSICGLNDALITTDFEEEVQELRLEIDEEDS